VTALLAIAEDVTALPARAALLTAPTRAELLITPKATLTPKIVPLFEVVKPLIVSELIVALVRVGAVRVLLVSVCEPVRVTTDEGKVGVPPMV
jgi:hypothetical protein